MRPISVDLAKKKCASGDLNFDPIFLRRPYLREEYLSILDLAT